VSVFFPATSRYCSNGYLINAPTLLNFNVGFTGACNLQKPPEKWSLWTTAPTQLTGASSVQPMYASSLFFFYRCTDVFNLPIIGSFGAKP
jgi:hypothetical protein